MNQELVRPRWLWPFKVLKAGRPNVVEKRLKDYLKLIRSPGFERVGRR